MTGSRPTILITGLTLLLFSIPTSIKSASLYRCVNPQGFVLLTDNVPTDPGFKCSFAASYRDLTPKERANEQIKAETRRQQIRVNVDAVRPDEVSQGANTYDTAYEMKRKALEDNSSKAYKEYHEEEERRIQRKEKQPSYKEKILRDAMFAAQKEEHDFVFSKENIDKGRVLINTMTSGRKASR